MISKAGTDWQCPECLHTWHETFFKCVCGHVKTDDDMLNKENSMGSGADTPKDELDAILKERGANYGPPIYHFSCTRDMYDVWEDRRVIADPPCGAKEAALRHGVYMILDKLARAAENPKHMDNWDDIKGYAECIKKVLEDKE